MEKGEGSTLLPPPLLEESFYRGTDGQNSPPVHDFHPGKVEFQLRTLPEAREGTRRSSLQCASTCRVSCIRFFDFLLSFVFLYLQNSLFLAPDALQRE